MATPTDSYLSGFFLRTFQLYEHVGVIDLNIDVIYRSSKYNLLMY